MIVPPPNKVNSLFCVLLCLKFSPPSPLDEFMIFYLVNVLLIFILLSCGLFLFCCFCFEMASHRKTSQLEIPYVAQASLMQHMLIHHYTLHYGSSSGARVAMNMY